MPFYENGSAKIHYEETGSGFPLLIVPGGGLNGVIADATDKAPIDTFKEFKNEFRCITLDERLAKNGQSSGPLEVDRPWDMYTDDHLGLMDHLGIDKFLMMGFCIGGPFIWNMLKRAGDRVVAGVLAQPVGFRPEMPDRFIVHNKKGWGEPLCERNPDITPAMIDTFLDTMFNAPADFVFTVTRDFVKACETPLLIMPDDTEGHPYAVAMETAMLAPNAQVSLYPWKEPKERIPLAVRHVRTFLQAHRPAG
ncbi:MAG: alpha/beta hydrolase [Rhodospirillales bacterium]